MEETKVITKEEYAPSNAEHTKNTINGKLNGEKFKEVKLFSVRKKPQLLYNIKEIPIWQQNNNNISIKDGYLIETNSYMKCFKALSCWNNESFNIWINIIVSIIYLILLILFTDIYLIPNYPSTTMTDYIIINFFLATAFQSSIFSAGSHCFRIHSLSQAKLWGKISNLGIITHLTCSSVTLLYYCYYDNVFYFKLLTMFTFVFTIAMTTIILTDFFGHPKLLAHRGILFILFGFSLVFAPLSIGVLKFGKQKVIQRINLSALSIELGFYLLAVLFYMLRLPERFITISSQYQLTSFNLFYICYIIASYCHLKLLITSFILMRTGSRKPTLISFG